MSARFLAPVAIHFVLLFSTYSPLAECTREEAQTVHHHAESMHGDLRALYVNTLKKSVTGILLETPAYQPEFFAEESNLRVVPFDLQKRINGQDWPVQVMPNPVWTPATALLACVMTASSH